MSAFFAMDGYAAFVWPAYALTVAGIGALVFQALWARKAAADRLARLQALEQAAQADAPREEAA